MGRAVSDHLGALDEMLLTQERMNRETQEAVMQTRMVPAKSVFSRLQRSMRQTCRLTGKQVELAVAGGDTLMDSEMLNGIVDPLMHLLRNAVDHGIEDTAERRIAGKPEVGEVQIGFQREGSNILIRCSDDGAGIDFAAVRRVAEEKSLLHPGEEANEDALMRILLQPNFSTREKATQTSGRGVGLDVVFTAAAQLGGNLRMESRAGAGCVFELRLPATLMSSHALVVRNGASMVAGTTRAVEQLIGSDEGEIRSLGDAMIFRRGDMVYPAFTMEAVLGQVQERRAAERGARTVILVRTGNGVKAVLAEGVVSSREIVVKSLGRYVPVVRGIVGATILGDGNVTPVLDLPELLRAAHRGPLDATVTGARTKDSAAPLVR